LGGFAILSHRMIGCSSFLVRKQPLLGVLLCLVVEPRQFAFLFSAVVCMPADWAFFVYQSQAIFYAVVAVLLFKETFDLTKCSPFGVAIAAWRSSLNDDSTMTALDFVTFSGGL